MTDAAAVPPVRPRRFGPWRRELWALVELFAIAGLAIAQPALDVVSRNVEIITARHGTATHVVVTALIIMTLPALAGWSIEVIVGLVWPPARRWTHAVIIGILAGVLVEQIAKTSTDWSPVPLIVTGALAAVIGAMLAIRAGWFRTVLHALAFAPPVFVALFLFASPVETVAFSHADSRPADVTVRHPHRLVMIVMDEFPTESLLDGNGAVDAQLYPNFAALAGTSTWYRNTTTVSNYTGLAVPAIGTGRYPDDPSDLPIPVDHPDNIFRLLGGSYRMNVHEQSFVRLCPEELCRSRTSSAYETEGGVGSLLREATRLWSEFSSPERTRATFELPEVSGATLDFGTSFVDSITPGRRVVDYVHLLLPHQPWRYLPTLQDVGATSTGLGQGYGSWIDASAAEMGRERHILNAQAMDTLLGRIVDKLHAVGAWKESMVVVTADHGESFLADNPLRGVSRANARHLLWTPLFVKHPDQSTGQVSDRPTELIDVVPTIADQLGVQIPWKVDGVAIRPTPRADFRRRLYQWDAFGAKQPGQLEMSDGSYRSFASRANFEKVLQARAAPAGGPPELRPYRIGPYGSLVGRDVASLTIANAPSSTRFAPTSPQVLDDVDPTAPTVPWTFVQGNFSGLPRSATIAFTINGVVAGIGHAWVLGDGGTGTGGGTLAPTLFRSGPNELGAFIVTGPSEFPRLRTVAVQGITKPDRQIEDATASVRDDFHRADDASGLGRAPTGQVWRTVSGAWQLRDDAAVGGSTGRRPGLATVDAGSPATVSMVVGQPSSGAGLAFRCMDDANCWWIAESPEYGTWGVWKVVAGRQTYVGNVGVAPSTAGTTLTVGLNGDEVRITVDGVDRLTVRSADLAGAAPVGLAVSSGAREAVGAWSRFVVTPAPSR